MKTVETHPTWFVVFYLVGAATTLGVLRFLGAI